MTQPNTPLTSGSQCHHRRWGGDDGSRRKREVPYINEGSYVSQQTKKNKVTYFPSVSGVF